MPRRRLLDSFKGNVRIFGACDNRAWEQETGRWGFGEKPVFPSGKVAASVSPDVSIANRLALTRDRSTMARPVSCRMETLPAI
jgi:hypothetical protein